MSETYWKLAQPDGWDFYTGYTLNYRAALGTVVTCQDYAATQMCGAGIHISTQPNDCFVGASVPCSAYRVEPVAGLIRLDAQKSKCHSVRVMEEMTDLSALFQWDYAGCCAFLRTLKTMAWFAPSQAADPAWHRFPTRAAARDAASRATRNATRNAARTVAGDAAWDAGRAGPWGAAGSVVWDAVENAARDAVRDVTWNVAWDTLWGDIRDAARDAAFYALTTYVCAGLPAAQDAQAHAAARWRVWTAGYGVLCDCDGELYVYDRPDRAA